jgi:hypothetical protein
MGQFLSVKVIAGKLGLSPWSIYRAIGDGIIPGRRLRPLGRILLKEADVEAALVAIRPPTPHVHQPSGEPVAAIG